MGILEIYRYLRNLMLPVIEIIGIEFFFIVLFYFLYYRKRQSEGQLRIQMKKLVLGALLIGYVVFVLELTTFGRGSSDSMRTNLHLFSSYVDAWNKYSLRDLQLSIYNILMFIPLGILLPLISRKFKAFKWLLPVVVSTTLLIETSQLVTGGGIFELDDLFNNTLGGIIGYQLYRLATSIVHNKKVRIKSLLGNLAIPLIMVLLFVGMHIFYSLQEFGNLAINSYTKWNMSDVKVTTSLQLSSAPTVAPVYKRIIDRDGVEALLQQKLGFSELKIKDENGNREILLEDKSGSQNTLYLSVEGNWSLSEDNYAPERTSFANNEPMIEKAKAIMADLGLLPQEAEFTAMESGQFLWNLPDTAYSNKDYWAGSLSLGLKKDGNVYSLNNWLQKNKFIREVDILSPAEVYARIQKGEFPQIQRNAILKPDQLVIKKGDQLVITGIELTFMSDTKGYNQPIYRVYGIFNEDSNWFTLLQAKRY